MPDIDDDDSRAAPPIAGAGGLGVTDGGGGDPYLRLDHLMSVVEELCPRWPERDPTSGEQFLL